MNCLITVVIPIYNSERMLDKCVSSVVRQTYKNLEIILVDDGSSDNSPAICDAWASKDARVKVFHKSNAGAGIARNTGIEYATGEYICFVDSDDYLEYTALEECISHISECPADAVVFGSSKLYADGTVTPETLAAKRKRFEGNQLVEELLPSFFVYGMGFGVSVWGRLFKLSVIRENNIVFKSEREIYSEDAFFNLEFFSKASSAAIVSKHFYYYYENDNSLSRTVDVERQRMNNLFLVKATEYVNSNALPRSLVWHIQARYHGCTMMAAKQIASSEMDLKDKIKCLKNLYNDSVLRGTLHTDVFRLETKTLALFFRLIKMKCYPLCNLLLWIRIQKRI